MFEIHKNGWMVLVTLELGYEKGKTESGFSAIQNITGRRLCISFVDAIFWIKKQRRIEW